MIGYEAILFSSEHQACPGNAGSFASASAPLSGQRPLDVTFHRAMDVAREPLQILDELIELGIERVLTSGQEETALAGSETIAALVERAAGRLVVMAGGGIDARNVKRVVCETGVREVHATLRANTASQMTYRDVRCSMGGALRPEEFSWFTTSSERIKALRAAL